MTYNKILIVGGIGSGKTTLGNKLSKILNIKTYELDDIAYKKREIFEKQKPSLRNKKIKELVKRKKWIIEGFYSRYWTYAIYRKADIVIILNIKPSISKRRLIIRYLKRKFSLKIKTNLKRTLSLLKYIEDYPKRYFKMQKDAAKEYSKKYVVLNNDKEIKQFIKSLI